MIKKIILFSLLVMLTIFSIGSHIGNSEMESRTFQDTLIIEENVSNINFNNPWIMEGFMADRNPTVPKIFRDIYIENIVAASQEFHIPAFILLIIIDVESSYQYNAVSNKNCYGLGQINVSVWKKDKNFTETVGKIDKYNIYDPNTNIRAMAYIIKHYYNKAVKIKQAKFKNELEQAISLYYGRTKDKKYYNKMEKTMTEYIIYTTNCMMKEHTKMMLGRKPLEDILTEK